MTSSYILTTSCSSDIMLRQYDTIRDITRPHWLAYAEAHVWTVLTPSRSQYPEALSYTSNNRSSLPVLWLGNLKGYRYFYKRVSDDEYKLLRVPTEVELFSSASDKVDIQREESHPILAVVLQKEKYGDFFQELGATFEGFSKYRSRILEIHTAIEAEEMAAKEECKKERLERKEKRLAYLSKQPSIVQMFGFWPIISPEERKYFPPHLWKKPS